MISKQQVTRKEDEELMEIFLYAKHTLLLHPNELMKEGIVVKRIDQRENQAVLGCGYIFHQGVTVEHFSINEAINFVPFWWLRNGLPQLVSYLRFIRRFVSEYQKCETATIKSLLSDRIHFEIVNFIPREFTMAFMYTIEQELDKRHLDQRFKDFTDADVALIRSNLNEVYAILNTDAVVAYIKKFQATVVELK